MYLKTSVFFIRGSSPTRAAFKVNSETMYSADKHQDYQDQAIGSTDNLP
jgi:hypothetical protein